MGKAISEAALTTRNARLKLPEGVHWRGIDPETHIGYRKGKRAGRWLVRWYQGDQKYRQEPLGVTDDEIGPGNLDFHGAVRAARALVAERRAAAEAARAGPIETVRSAVERYIEQRDARETARQGRPSKSSAHRLKKHVLHDEEFAELELFRLTKARLAKWRRNLPGSVGARERVTNDFRAALNAAAPDAAVCQEIAGGLRKPEQDRIAPVARENQLLTDDEIRRLIAAARDINEDFYRMILVLAATGARFAQVRRLRVGDLSGCRLMMPPSYKGRSGIAKNRAIPVPIGDDVIAALEPATAGRKNGAPLLERLRMERGGLAAWKPGVRAAWKTASELTRQFATAAKAAGLPVGTVPYALRHSSIVRQLRQGLPVTLVAQTHDTSAAMIEDHYAAEIASALEALTARTIIPLVIDRIGQATE